MHWWAWITVGAILLGAELTLVDAQFYLVIIGVAALAVGVAALAGLASDWLQWLLFSALALTAMAFFRRRIYERVRRKLPTVRGGPAGEMVTLSEPLDAGATGRVDFRGSTWSVLNGGGSAISAGGRARIVSVEGLTLVVHADR